MINIFHIVPFGPGFNIGNFLIQQATRRQFRRYSKEPINFITIPSRGGAQDSGLTKSVIHRINRQGNGVIVGGGNLFENGDLNVDPNAMIALRKPLIVFSASYGRLYDESAELHRRTDTLPDALSKSVIERSCRFVARDTATATYARELASGADVQVGGCPTLFMTEYGITNTLQDELGFSVKTNALVAVRNPEQMNVPQSLKNQAPQLTRDLLRLLEERCGREPYLLCNDQRDIEYAQSLSRRAIYTSDVYEYFSLLQTVDVCVSFRVHTSLPLWSLSRKAINLSYDERSQSLIDTIGCHDRNVNIITSDDAVGDVERRIDRYASRVPDWGALAEVQRQCIRDFFDEVANS